MISYDLDHMLYLKSDLIDKERRERLAAGPQPYVGRPFRMFIVPHDQSEDSTPKERMLHRIVRDEKHIYLYGGVSRRYEYYYFEDMWRFNPNTSKWTMLMANFENAERSTRRMSRSGMCMLDSGAILVSIYFFCKYFNKTLKS